MWLSSLASLANWSSSSSYWRGDAHYTYHDQPQWWMILTQGHIQWSPKHGSARWVPRCTIPLLFRRPYIHCGKYNYEKKYDDNDKICQRKLTMINMDNNTYTNMVMIKFDDTDHSISHSREQSSDPIPSLSLFNLCWERSLIMGDQNGRSEKTLYKWFFPPVQCCSRRCQ